MKFIFATLTLSLAFQASKLMAGPATPLSTEELRQKFTASLQSDFDKKPNPRMELTFKRITNSPLNALNGSDMQRMASFLDMDSVSNETLALFNELMEQVQREELERSERIYKEYPGNVIQMLRKAMASNDASEIRRIKDELADVRMGLRGKRDVDISSIHTLLSNSVSCLSLMAEIEQMQGSESHANVASSINLLKQNFGKIVEYIPSDEAYQYIRSLRKRAGILSREEYDQKLTEWVDRLLDDANQDQLDKIMEEIASIRKVSEGLSSSDYPNLNSRLRQLESISNSIRKGIQIVRDGGLASFSIDSLSGDNWGNPPLIKKSELEKRLATYRVRNVPDGQKESWLYYDSERLQKWADGTLASILDDANQDRLPELMNEIKTYRQAYGSSPLSSRLQQIEYLSRSLSQAVASVKGGGLPRANIDQWLQSGSEYPPLMKTSDMLEHLRKYRVRVPIEDGEFVTERLYLDQEEVENRMGELLRALLDDENQDRLEELHEEIRMLRRVSTSYSPGFERVSGRIQQMESLSRLLMQSVQRMKDGLSEQANIDQWLYNGSDYRPIMTRARLVKALKQYRVKVRGSDGSETEEPIYIDIKDVLGRINHLDDLERELPSLMRAASQRSTSTHGGPHDHQIQQLQSLARLCELLRGNESFTLHSIASPNFTGISSHSNFTPKNPNSGVTELCDTLAEEAFLRVARRLLPQETIKGSVRELQDHMLKQKNYDSLLVMQQVAAILMPNRPVLASHEETALRNYLDGVRQLNILGQPRLATMHFQRAAAARSTILADEELRRFLEDLQSRHPESYQQGTDDALAAKDLDVGGRSPFSAPLVIPTARK